MAEKPTASNLYLDESGDEMVLEYRFMVNGECYCLVHNQKVKHLALYHNDGIGESLLAEQQYKVVKCDMCNVEVEIENVHNVYRLNLDPVRELVLCQNCFESNRSAKRTSLDDPRK